MAKKDETGEWEILRFLAREYPLEEVAAVSELYVRTSVLKRDLPIVVGRLDRAGLLKIVSRGSGNLPEEVLLTPKGGIAVTNMAKAIHR